MATGTLAQGRFQRRIMPQTRAEGSRRTAEERGGLEIERPMMGARSRGRNRRTGRLQSYPQHPSEAVEQAQWSEQAQVRRAQGGRMRNGMFGEDWSVGEVR